MARESKGGLLLVSRRFWPSQFRKTGFKTAIPNAVHVESDSGVASTSVSDAFDETRGDDPTLKSEKIASTLESIGRRNETLREQFESIEFSFRNIEAIRTQFQDALTEINEILAEIERTKVTHLEAERTLESVTAAHERLKAAHLDALEVQRLSKANLQEKLDATTARLETTERLLAKARAGMHEQDATIREFEKCDLEKSVAEKSLEAEIGISISRLWSCPENQKTSTSSEATPLPLEPGPDRNPERELEATPQKVGEKAGDNGI
jgi:septal ring factor EnvC (AmiA/AmiB activator)